MDSRFQAFRFATFFTLFVLFIVSVPVIFYISISIKYSNLQQVDKLKEFAYQIERNIYQNKQEIIPPSLIYKSALFSNSKTVQSNFTITPPKQQGSYTIQDMIYYGKALKDDALDYTYIIVGKKQSYNEVMLNAIYIVGILFLLILLLSYLALRASIKPFDDTNRYMQNFFNDAMHELKTPLGIMQLNLELLASGTNSKKAILRIHAALSSLGAVFDDLEYLIKLKNVKYSSEEINFSKFLQDRCDFFSPLFETKELSLHSNIEDKIFININRTELQRVIDNNITNAIKYAYKHTQVSISLYKTDDSVVFEVYNEGVGIKDKNNIFRRYTKEDEIKGGFGIGLSIVKSICQKYSIKIIVETEISKYAKFKYIF